MIVKVGNKVYCDTPEAAPDWERFRPATDYEHGEDVVTFNGIQGRWKYDGSVTSLEIIEIVLKACKE